MPAAWMSWAVAASVAIAISSFLCRHRRLELGQPRRYILHEPAHRAAALLLRPPVLAGHQHQHAKAADFLVKALDAVVDRIRIAAIECAAVDQVLERQV